MVVMHISVYFRYAPSLRHLRQYSLLLYFPPTISARLASRLHQVSQSDAVIVMKCTIMCFEIGDETRENDCSYVYTYGSL